MQRPEFVRLTKHSNISYEDSGYSYVVIRRGARPHPTRIGFGRTGGVGERAIQKDASKAYTHELQFYDGGDMDLNPHNRQIGDSQSGPSSHSEEECTREEIDEALRLEAFQWPRLVFPPLKKSGHIILDGCTAEGAFLNSICCTIC